jgi:Domain of unknown function (DUF1707)
MTPLLEALATEAYPPPQGETPPRMRASDADREAVVRTLIDAIARGLLTLQEGDERVAAAYAARFLDDLPRLTADLPPAPASAPAAPGWRALALLTWLQVRTAVSGLGRGIRRAVRSRPPRLAAVAIATVALLALLSVMAATAVGEADHRGHGDYGYSHDDDHGHGWGDHDDDDHDHDWEDHDDDD